VSKLITVKSWLGLSRAVLFAALSANLGAAEITMADLAALKQQKGFAEILAKAGEIAPSKRDAAWQAVVLEAAIAQAKSSKSEEFSYFDADIATRFPSVAALPAYQNVVQPKQLESASSCMAQAYSDVSYCIKALNDAAARAPGNTDFAYQAAEAIARGSNASNGMLMLKNAVSAGNKKHCSSARTADITMAALAMPSGEISQAASDVAGICFEQMKAPILKALATESVGGYVMKNTCGMMQKQGALKGLIQQKCAASLKAK
jgi:hypothetical protein